MRQYFNMLTCSWLQLDLHETHLWKCADDSSIYQQIVEQKRTIRFLLGLNKDLDEVKGRVMGIKPFPTIREAFAEVRREESRTKLMLSEANITPALEGSALFTHNSSQNNRAGKGRPWCDHCKRLGHVKATCWKLHGKPVDWKPSNCQERDSRANAATSTKISVENSPFTREQIEALQKMSSGSSQTSSSHVKQHTSLLAHQGTPSLVFSVQINKPRPWIVDSGASYHMTGNFSILTDFQPCSSHLGVRIADGTISPVAGTGSVHIT